MTDTQPTPDDQPAEAQIPARSHDRGVAEQATITLTITSGNTFTINALVATDSPILVKTLKQNYDAISLLLRASVALQLGDTADGEAKLCAAGTDLAETQVTDGQ